MLRGREFPNPMFFHSAAPCIAALCRFQGTGRARLWLGSGGGSYLRAKWNGFTRATSDETLMKRVAEINKGLTCGLSSKSQLSP